MRAVEFLKENSYRGDGSPGMVMGQASDARADTNTYEDRTDEYKLDNEKGMGAVSNNSGGNPDYFGIRVMMKPSTFHRLALHLPGDQRSSFYKEMVKKVAQGEPIASPFLDIIIPDEWEEGDYSEPAKVRGHEGRHRMYAVNDVDGDVPVEVHIWGRFKSSEMRRRHLNDEMIDRILAGLISEEGNDYVTNIGTLKR